MVLDFWVKSFWRFYIVFRIWSNKAQERKLRKLAALEFKYKWDAVIDTAFSPKNLAQLVPLKGSELDAFAFMYRPTPAQYASNNFNLLDYVNACYKKFKQLPKEKQTVSRLTPLPPTQSKSKGHVD